MINPLSPGTVKIADRLVGPGQPVLVIAEAGVNHNGQIDLALRLIDAAVEAGADAVKFQTFTPSLLASPDAVKADYQARLTGGGESQLEMLRSLALSAEAHFQLSDYCASRGIVFLSTPFDETSLELLVEVGVPALKVGSGEITNWPFLELISRQDKPIILSTGMSSLGEVEEALQWIRPNNEEIVLLHCLSDYPASPSEINLRAMGTMARAFALPVGYSDHTTGIEISLAAVALGACVIEKHLTLDRNLPGPDHQASLEPTDFRNLTIGVRKVEQARGSGVKVSAPSEAGTRRVARRSLAASYDLPAGTILEPRMLTALRPGTGLHPGRPEVLLGRRLKRDAPASRLLSLGDFE